MTESRVLVVEDDEAASYFVTEALEGLDLQVRVCRSVEAAQEALAAQPVQLVITDLGFEGASGFALIHHLRGLPVPPVVIVFSGGLHAAVREQLASLGVFRTLAKPASRQELAHTVRQALNLSDWPEAPNQETRLDPTGLKPFELAAIETFFDGDRTFYETFRASCVEQFAVDLAAGDQACAAGDAAALRRVAHSLKSVLQTLGYADHSVCARSVEEAAQHRALPDAATGWQDLRQRIVQSFGLSV
jgi:CheY-like chemotaxis protein/HPt (histidine-containing phosphotransfer) domain-containing protein